MVAQKNWTVYQLDFKSAFLNGELKEVVHVTQPKGYIRKGEETKVYRLRRALYGLKKALELGLIELKGISCMKGSRKAAKIILCLLRG